MKSGASMARRALPDKPIKSKAELAGNSEWRGSI